MTLMRATSFEKTCSARPTILVYLMSAFWFAPRLVASAASGEFMEVIRFLNDGDDVNERNKFGSNALLLAVQYQHMAVIHTLLRIRHIDVNIQNPLGQTALMKAAMCGNLEIVDLLCGHPDIDVDIEDNKGWTAFMHAQRDLDIQIILLTVSSRNMEMIMNPDEVTFQPKTMEDFKYAKYLAKRKYYASLRWDRFKGSLGSSIARYI